MGFKNYRSGIFANKDKLDSKLTLNISRNSIPEVRPKVFPIYMLHVFATPSLATWRPQQESLRSGSWQDVTRTSLSDRFRARGEEVSWRRLRSSSCLPCVPVPATSQPLSFLPSPRTVRRGCDEDISWCAGDEQRARFGTLRLLYVEGVGIEFRHEDGRERGWVKWGREAPTCRTVRKVGDLDEVG